VIDRSIPGPGLGWKSSVARNLYWGRSSRRRLDFRFPSSTATQTTSVGLQAKRLQRLETSLEHAHDSLDDWIPATRMCVVPTTKSDHSRRQTPANSGVGCGTLHALSILSGTCFRSTSDFLTGHPVAIWQPKWCSLW
jgi:hypothetical protein